MTVVLDILIFNFR